MTDAAIIYRSHVEAIETLPAEQQLEAYKALIAYCMDDETPEAGIGAFAVGMAKPLLDKWKAKRIAGQKGGISEKQPEATGKQTEATGKQTETTSKQPEAKVKEKVKVKEKDNNKLPFGEYGNVRMTAKEHETLISEFGEQQAEQAIKFLDEYIAEKGYKSKSHYLAIRRWVFDAVSEKKQKPPNRAVPGTKFQNFPARQDQEHKDMVARLIAMQ